MRIRFRGAASVVLIILVIGCGISAIAQSSSGNKADVPSPPATASNASNGSASTEVTSASAKTVLPAVDPSAGNHSSHPDLKAASSLKGKVNELYTVGVADGLFVSVWKEPDLSGAVVVRPDGMITVPVVGDVHVVGLTTPQVQNLLTEKLKDVVAEPQVTVIVRDIRSRKAYLIGKVGHPAQLPSPARKRCCKFWPRQVGRRSWPSLRKCMSCVPSAANKSALNLTIGRSSRAPNLT